VDLASDVWIPSRGFDKGVLGNKSRLVANITQQGFAFHLFTIMLTLLLYNAVHASAHDDGLKSAFVVCPLRCASLH
jgi:hypothetical protein